MIYAVICTDKPDHLSMRMETRPTHLAWVDKLNADGILKIAGPFLDDEGKSCGSMLLIEAGSQADAEALAAEDPYARAGLFAKTEVRPFKWLYNNPEEA
ncbi:hypothetical protein FJU08_09265 [Martelella alba]|uniref:YCII-related domain-containing protein n=1 Tax=Martelella alba TaxID=2590451 RepID=A0A506UD25_9HYPH|nr:YciI family protein [Martelella alba]TPW30854.1 hypothetical protein FJU08_09265 [Martelella alba]